MISNNCNRNASESVDCTDDVVLCTDIYSQAKSFASYAASSASALILYIYIILAVFFLPTVQSNKNDLLQCIHLYTTCFRKDLTEKEHAKKQLSVLEPYAKNTSFLGSLPIWPINQSFNRWLHPFTGHQWFPRKKNKRFSRHFFKMDILQFPSPSHPCLLLMMCGWGRGLWKMSKSHHHRLNTATMALIWHRKRILQDSWVTHEQID